MPTDTDKPTEKTPEEIEAPMLPEVRAQLHQVLGLINNDMFLQSLLYDLGLMPEQHETGSREWCKMLTVVSHWKAFTDSRKSL